MLKRRGEKKTRYESLAFPNLSPIPTKRLIIFKTGKKNTQKTMVQIKVVHRILPNQEEASTQSIRTFSCLSDYHSAQKIYSLNHFQTSKLDVFMNLNCHAHP